MATRRGPSQEAESDSSSSGGEDLERLREATWEPPGLVKKPRQGLEDCASPVVPSLRVRPDKHEHDGNELQTTPEFRSHVAKKLAALLDSCIKEIPASKSFSQKSTAASDSASEDEGFRLLTTSVPGDSGKISPPPVLKRRAASSTSEDSEEEKQRRCREAAVSGFDILKHSAIQTTLMNIQDTTNVNPPERKKKKKKKAKKKSRPSDETEEEHMEPEGKINGLKKKKQTEITEETQSDDLTNHPDSKREPKKSKLGSHGVNVTPESGKDGLKKKKKEEVVNDGIAFDRNMNSLCGNSGTKKKKKKALVRNCDEPV
ncbi:protein CUSTOS [Engystomops pustulosus]|uniref:protein CUSTOS n=1 Tax=Engystomops pustulosus TaxID=76066 RepID=UPI003AFA0FF6